MYSVMCGAYQLLPVSKYLNAERNLIHTT